ncbi:MAG: RimK family alpha-L-glutamate ligase [Pirellulales bacterium]
MHFAVLASPDSWYLKDLTRAAGQRHRISLACFTELAARVQIDGEAVWSAGTQLRDVDGVLVRTMPPGSLEQVVFRMDALARLEAAGILVLNPPKAIETAVDKYLCSARLQAAGLPVPRTIICQTVDDAMAGFEELGQDVVIKPVFGAEGRGIARLNDEAMALRAFKLLADLRAVIYLQEFVPHEGCDLRVFAVGDHLLAMRRRNPLDWRTNVSRGATGEAVEISDEMARLARASVAAVGAPVAGVDLLPARDGRLLVIEVNAVPGWQALGRACKVDVAELVLSYCESRVLGTAR